MKNILTFIDHIIWMEKIHLAIRQYAAERQWQVTNFDTKERPNNIFQIIKERNPAGCIIAGTNQEFLKAVRNAGQCPIIQLFPYGNSSCSTVTVNDLECGQLAADKLRELKYSTFACVPTLYGQGQQWDQPRSKGFVKAIRRAGNTCTVFSASTGNHTENFIQKLGKWLINLPKPCGVFATNDRIAELTLQAAQQQNIPIPQSIGILGVDDNELVCLNTKPTLSSICPDWFQCGYRAAELLNEAMETPGMKPRHIMVEFTGVTLRQSTSPCIVNNVQVDEAVRFIKEKVCQGISTADVLRVFPCSRRRAEMLFREVRGCSIGEEILRERMQKVCQLLRDPDCQIETIGARCGYANQNSLRKIFHSQIGMSLTAWRKENADDAVNSAKKPPL